MVNAADVVVEDEEMVAEGQEDAVITLVEELVWTVDADSMPVTKES